MAYSVYNQISDTGRTNVVARGYLHSTTFNFRNAVATELATSKFFMDEKYYKDTEKKLIALKNKAEARENEFYSIFGINSNDIPRNAYAFNRLFKKSLSRYQVLKKMNSRSFIQEVDNKLIQMVQAVAKYFEDLCLSEKVPIDKVLNFTDIESFFDQSLKMLNKIYPLTLGKPKTGRLKKVIMSTGRVNKKYEARFGEIFDMLPEESRKIVNNESEDLLNRMILFLHPDEEFEKLIRSSFAKIEDKLNLKTYERNNRVGILGEISANMMIDLLLDKMADDAPKSFYVGDLYGDNKKQSPIDFLIGQYGIQVKNTLESIENSSVKPFYDIKLQTDITLNSFMKKLGENEESFRYLITNVAWLRNNGLDKDGNEDRLKFSDIPKILEFINNILAQQAEQLFHTQTQGVFDKQGRQIATSYGNTFFLLKNTYLIPISMMIDGVLKALRLEHQKDSKGVGYFYRDDLGVTNKSGKEVKLTGAANISNAQKIQEQKKLILADMASSGSLNMSSFDYSGELLDYGAGLGRDLSSGMNIRIKYKFITENLNKINNHLKVW